MDSLDTTKASVLSQIQALSAECVRSGWDATEAEPVCKSAASRAADFIRALPEGFPLPEIAPEPDGSISLDWIRSRSRVFSLSVGMSNRLPYAWINDRDSGHAVAAFDGKNIPPDILERLRAA
jgi:hypothetical protein